MDIKDVKAEFAGFGPIPSSRTTFAQGIGMGGSFAPIWTTQPELPAKRVSSQHIPEAVTYPFHLTVVSVTGGTGQVSKIRVQYGEIDGLPPSGMTQGDDYLLEPGNSFIYLIVTFDGNGRISSRTIGFDNPVPDDTNDTKHIVIGEVAYAGGVYTIINQNISQDVYPEKALVVDRSNGSFVYSLFADPRKINAIYELENFNVNLDGDNLTTTLYLKSEDNAEYLELKKDSNTGEVAVDGFSGNSAQNFVISANDTDSTTKVVLFDSGSATYLENKIDTDNSKSSVHGYAGNQSQNFVLSSDSTNDISKLELFDSSSANFVTVKTAGADQTGVYGYYNQENYFDLKGDQNGSQLELWGDTSNCYCKLKTSTSETSLYGYIDEQSEYFILKAKNEDTQLYLGSGSNYVKIDIPDNNGSLVNAYWQEIDICVDGTPKKMKVLGTEPYTTA